MTRISREEHKEILLKCPDAKIISTRHHLYLVGHHPEKPYLILQKMRGAISHGTRKNRR